MKKTYCDRCNKESSSCYSIKASVEMIADDGSIFNVPVGSSQSYDLCEDCYKKLIEFIGKNKDEN